MSSIDPHSPGRIHVLPGIISRKIAAGEVIERPHSVLRELLDNSIDSGADEIVVELKDGGLGRIRVSDNGSGMSEHDLDLCYLAHSTSKLSTEEDLLQIATMGFRGEALSSIGSVSHLEIASRPPEGGGGRIVVEDGNCVSKGDPLGTTGTAVDVQRLFYNVPARKRFLKRASTEAGLCKSVFTEKAIANRGIAFRLFQDGKDPLVIGGETFLDRIACAYPGFGARLLTTITHTGDEARLTAVVADTSLARRDRKMIQTFVNRRRIWEFGFVQAVEYGLSDLFHGGTFPVCFLFLEVDPRTVDFNVHPAKREARFTHRDRLHHEIVTLLKSEELRATAYRGHSAYQGHSATYRPSNSDEKTHAADLFAAETEHNPSQRHFPDTDRAAPPSSQRHPRSDHHPRRPFDAAFRDALRSQSAPPHQTSDSHEIQDTEVLLFHGQAFSLFLIIEKGDKLYFIDQHAAHERILYDLFRSDKQYQKLLVPLEFEVEDDEVETVTDRAEQAASLGIHIEHIEGNRFSLTAVPSVFHGTESHVIEALQGLDIISGAFERDLYATIACRASIMRGDSIDHVTALELARRTFALPQPRCPHGRPLWHVFDRNELFALVGRD